MKLLKILLPLALCFLLLAGCGKKVELAGWEDYKDHPAQDVYAGEVAAPEQIVMTRDGREKNSFDKGTETYEKIVSTLGQLIEAQLDENEQVKAYVLDESCRKQPFGAWGKLYIMDHPTLGWSDKITNPYGPGMLYQTGREARIMPDGRLEFLEQGGRTVMREGLTGRKFLDLYKLEQTLESADGVTKAEAYVRYGEGNKLVLQADVWGVSEADTERLRAYVREHCGEALVPECISCF